MALTALAAQLHRVTAALSGLQIGSLVLAGLRLVAGQVANECAEHVLSTVSDPLDWTAGLIPGGESVSNNLVVLFQGVGSESAGPLGLLIVLLWPVGGPVWGGLVPVTVTAQVLRGSWRLLREIPASGSGFGAQVTHTWLMAIDVVIVDDSSTFRELARRVLTRDGLEVVGLAGTGREALVLITTLRPQVALVDVHLGNESGFEVALAAGQPDGSPATVVVMMSTHGEDEVHELLALSPAAGFVAKEHVSGGAIRSIMAGVG